MTAPTKNLIQLPSSYPSPFQEFGDYKPKRNLMGSSAIALTSLGLYYLSYYVLSNSRSLAPVFCGTAFNFALPGLLNLHEMNQGKLNQKEFLKNFALEGFTNSLGMVGGLMFVGIADDASRLAKICGGVTGVLFSIGLIYGLTYLKAVAIPSLPPVLAS